MLRKKDRGETYTSTCCNVWLNVIRRDDRSDRGDRRDDRGDRGGDRSDRGDRGDRAPRFAYAAEAKDDPFSKGACGVTYRI